MKKAFNNKRGKFATCKRKEYELVTIDNLAVTPSQMMEMASHGIPVSTPNVELFYEGTENPSWNIPLEQQRGIDVAQLWQENRNIKRKALNYVKDVGQTEKTQ